MRGRALALLLLACVFIAPRTALAEGTAVRAASGVDVDPKALEAHLAVELDASTGVVRVDLAPLPDGLEARIFFADGTSEARTFVTADLGADGAPRVLALALAETARLHVAHGAATATPAPTPRPAPAAPPPAPPAPAVTASGTAEGPLAVGASLGGRVLGAVPNVGLEARLSAALVLRRFTIGVDATYLTAGASDPLGDVRLHALGGGIVAGIALPLGDHVALRLGPRLDVLAGFGDGTASGSALSGSARGAIVSLLGDARIAVRLGRFWPSLELAVDAGGVARGLDLRADARTPLAANGATFGARLGLLFR